MQNPNRYTESAARAWERRHAVLRWWEGGAKQREIARKLNIHPSRVAEMVGRAREERREGVCHPDYCPAARLEAIQDLYAALRGDRKLGWLTIFQLSH